MKGTDSVQPLQLPPIAIIGMSGIFPQAHNLREYWQNILNKIDCITDVPVSRWDIDDYYDPDPTKPDKTYCKRGGFLPDVDFDPLEFGLPPNILEVTDVSQLLGLVVAREAMADAGYTEQREFNRERTGCILGVGGGQKLVAPLMSRLQYPVWAKVLRSAGIAEADIEAIIEKMKLAYVRWEENSFPGLLGNVIAGRITNRLNLGGTNCVVDAACASSMGALKMAVSELIERRCDMMITGGVDTDNSIFMYMCFSKTPAFSRQANPRPFDKTADGMMVGEGLGMLVLKRLEDAERDGDRIYAVIRGIGTSSDGRHKSIYAPHATGQARALRDAYVTAGFAPNTIGLIESHGTGTVAGDLTEFTSLKTVFGADNPPHQTIALGSVKSQIGHTKAAAGAASLIKVALALHHKVLPATINVTEPNPKFEVDDSPFYVNTETRPWVRAEGAPPRRAGVSSFGFGGTNFHVVLEEYTNDHQHAYRLHDTTQQIVLHAPNPEALLSQMQQHAASLSGADATQTFYNLTSPIPDPAIPQPHARVGLVASSPREAHDLLILAADLLQKHPDHAEWHNPRGIYYRRTGMQVAGNVVALFSGQGSQYLEMGRELALHYPPVRQMLGAMDQLFVQAGKQPLSQVIFPPPAFTPDRREEQTHALQRTDYAQPAIGVLSASLYRIAQQAGLQPSFMAGHSFGELTALWAAGAINDTDFMRLMLARGTAMMPINNPSFDAGKMLAVSGDLVMERLQEDIRPFAGLQIANWNSPRQVVLAGTTAAVRAAQPILQSKGYACVALPVAAAFHTPLVGHAQQPFAQAVAQAQFSRPQSAVYANATGQRYPHEPAQVQQMLAQQMLQPVLFQRQIETIYNDGGRIFVEFGPRSVLTNLVRDILGNREYLAVSLNDSRKKDSDRQLQDGLVQLRVAGVPLRPTDTYALPVPAAPATARKGLKITLNGSNYVSDKTRQAFEDALQDGFQISTATTGVAHPPVAPLAEPAITPADPVVAAPIVPAPAPLNNGTHGTAAMLADSLTHFTRHQQAVLHLHEQYLQQQQQMSATITDLVGQQHTLLATGQLSEQVVHQLERSIALLREHQAETLRVHEQYLQRQDEHARNFLALVQSGEVIPPLSVTAEPASLAAPPAPAVPMQAEPPAPVASTVAASPAPAVPVAPAAAVETPITPVAVAPLAVEPVAIPSMPVTPAFAHSFDTLLGQIAPVAPVLTPIVAEAPAAPVAVAMPTPVIEAPATSNSSNGNGGMTDELTAALLAIVSDKTGYPAEMLDPAMDLEADLGIDSIKRVEILGALQDQFPALPRLSPDDLGELRSLGQIVTVLQGGANVAPVLVIAEPVAPATPVTALAPAAPATSNGSNGGMTHELTAALLAIVSDKTGYPAEMLDPAMDLEADLGIDSIKRVEILGALQDQFPALPRLSPDDLGELRSLDQIVTVLQGGASVAPVLAPIVAEAPAVPVTAVAPIVAVAPAPAAPASNGNGGNGGMADELTAALLAIVSDKTGYPAEMLDPAMDLEADLGIDSIKRVEILGALQDQFPALPRLSPDDLGELRSLGQIVTVLQGGANVAPVLVIAEPVAPATPVTALAPAAPATSNGSNGGMTHELTAALLAIVSDKTGYPAEMLDPAMDLEADLGIDSIKRVEILGALQDQFPALPRLSPDDLGELRSLGQIVTVLQGGANVAPVPVTPLAPAVAVTPAAPATSNGNGGNDGGMAGELTAALLAIVSDKTGYPAEMLDPAMDLEADLGIDSIKRVEILGALQDQFPALPRLSPDDLGELRSLGQIVTVLQGGASVAPANGNGYSNDSATNRHINGHIGNGIHGQATPYGNGHTVTLPPLPTLDTPIQRSVAQLRALPLPDQLAYTPPPTAVCLVTSDGTPLTTQLVQSLTERGWRVVVLHFPATLIANTAPIPAGVPQATLTNTDEAHLNATLQAISQSYGPIGSFIHLHPHFAQGTDLFAEADKLIVRHVFLLARTLKASLTEAAQHGYARFITVARLDGAFGLDQLDDSSIVSSGLFGLTKTLNLEWASVVCRALDISTSTPTSQAVQAILAELYDPNRLITEVGYGTRGRVTLHDGK